MLDGILCWYWCPHFACGLDFFDDCHLDASYWLPLGFHPFLSFFYCIGLFSCNSHSLINFIFLLHFACFIYLFHILIWHYFWNMGLSLSSEVLGLEH